MDAIKRYSSRKVFSIYFSFHIKKTIARIAAGYNLWFLSIIGTFLQVLKDLSLCSKGREYELFLRLYDILNDLIR